MNPLIQTFTTLFNDIHGCSEGALNRYSTAIAILNWHYGPKLFGLVRVHCIRFVVCGLITYIHKHSGDYTSRRLVSTLNSLTSDYHSYWGPCEWNHYNSLANNRCAISYLPMYVSEWYLSSVWVVRFHYTNQSCTVRTKSHLPISALRLVLTYQYTITGLDDTISLHQPVHSNQYTITRVAEFEDTISAHQPVHSDQYTITYMIGAKGGWIWGHHFITPIRSVHHHTYVHDWWQGWLD